MPENPQERAKRLAERKRVDDFMAAKRKPIAAAARKKKAAVKTAAKVKAKTPAVKARVRRDAIVKKAAPSGFQLLLDALSGKTRKKTPEKKK